ncbi:MAG: dynamin family protein [Candidatus Muirbacterium halophilum]|nr:dynamin family protein [Candidatus Muirbacterium halophilum]MCK9474472.1 dynamin family protein [Candidatus Muirbacterium halophilum]
MGIIDDKKELIIDNYKILRSLESVFPIKSGNETDDKEYFDKEYFDSEIKKIREDQFIISICGQMNAGKSLFVNAFLFGDKIVFPEGTVAETAKLSEISYSEKEYFKVHYYNKERWNKIENTEFYKLRIYPKIYPEFKSKTTYVDDILAKKTEEIDNIADINKYVGKEGKYTDFVEKIEVFLNNENLKGIKIVDTPGLNDPEEERSKLTEEFVKNSDAVILIISSDRAFDANDKDFVINYLKGVSEEKVILIANKLDTLGDVSEKNRNKIISCLENISDEQVKEFLKTTTKNLKMVSTQAYIYQNIFNKSPENCPAEIKDRLQIIDDKFPEIIENKGYFEDAKTFILNFLFKTKNIVNIHSEKLNKIIKETVKEIEKKKEDIEYEINSLEKPIATKKEEIKKIDGIKKEILNFNENVDKKLLGMNIEVRNKVDNILQGYYGSVEAEITSYIEKYSFNNIKLGMKFAICKIIRKNFNREFDLNSKIIDITDDIKQEFYQLINELKSKVSGFNVLTAKELECYFKIDNHLFRQTLMDEVEKEIDTDLSYLKENKWFFFKDEEGSKANIQSLVNGFFDDLSNEKDYTEQLSSNIFESFKQKSHNIKEELTNLSSQKQELLGENESEIGEIQNRKKNLEIKRLEIEKSLNSIKEAKDEIELKIKKLEVMI